MKRRTTVGDVEKSIGLELTKMFGEFPCFKDHKNFLKHITIICYTGKVTKKFMAYMKENLPQEVVTGIVSKYIA